MRNNGFTLLELSIVLVIIGLLVGGVLAGKNLIESAKVTNTISEVAKIKQAVLAFRTQYKELPGDMPRAADIWGPADGVGADGQGADCRDTVSTNKTTCNGDGNGQIARLATMSGTSSHEKLRAWQHLVNAGLLEGSYTGTANADGDIEGGVNVPAAPLTGVIYDMYTQEPGTIPVFGRLGLFIKLALPRDYDAYGAAFTTEQARSIENKYDDGSPDSGEIVVVDGFDTGGCVSNGTSSATTTEFLEGNVMGCRIFFWVE
jgi:prepilin-type N-terminal cleavage/methylation domain-containing protein